MNVAPPSDDEARRLAALDEYRILDTDPEQAYDDITRLASYICGVPIALISLVDESRQWFKSRVGLKQQETSRDQAFCAHTILGTDVMVVRDATRDKRFAANPLVTADPHVRFYAGAPLRAHDGHALGTLCVIDHVPRDLSPEQKGALEALARQVTHLLELRRVSEGLAGALTEVRTLRGMLPTCAYCRKVRDDEGFWKDVERYLNQHTGVVFTHGICEDCRKVHFAEYVGSR